jgi:hypothetical protein
MKTVYLSSLLIPAALLATSASFATGNNISGSIGKPNPTAMKQIECGAYADTAVKQNQQAINNKCGFKGNRWTSNRDSHYNWCMHGNNLKFTKQETANRAKDINNCPKIATKVAILPPNLSPNQAKMSVCLNYAETAVKQNQQAISKKCGFKGNRWSSNRDHHYNWCMHGNNIKFTKQGTNDRAKDLKSCKKPSGIVEAPGGFDPKGLKQVCKDYASTAVKQNKQAIQLKCGFTGLGWSSNYQAHYNWCISDGKNLMAAGGEMEARNIDLKACGKQAKKEDKDNLKYAIGGFFLGVIADNLFNSNNSYQQSGNQGQGGDHTGWCYSRYKSYRASDNTYQPYNGPRRQCNSPYN